MKTSISNAIHHNRDENSFTARFFERLIIRFENNSEVFTEFLSLMEKATESNNNVFLKNETLQPPLFGNMHYEDSMPFLENVDLFSYCINNDIKKGLGEDYGNKTEFDFVITAKDDFGKSIFIVFEVKCFTDLVLEEIDRQNKLLEKYKVAGLYDKYYHIALISYEDLVRGKVPKQAFPGINNFSIITWDDVKDYIDKRFNKEIEFSRLNKVIHQNGKGKTLRKLINSHPDK